MSSDIEKQIGQYSAAAREFLALGRNKEAFACANQAFKLARGLGEKHPLYAGTLNDIAQTYVTLGAHATAEGMFDEALKLMRGVLGETSSDFAITLSNRAQVYAEAGRHVEAERDFRRAIEILTTRAGAGLAAEEAFYLPTVKDNLALLYLNAGSFVKAERLYREAGEEWRRLVGEDDPRYAVSLSGLAELYHTIGSYQEALDNQRRALAIARKRFGPVHAEVARGLNNLARVYLTTQQYAEAEPLFRESLAVRLQTFGPDDPRTTVAMNNLAEVCRRVGKYEEAASLLRRALAVRARVYGQDDARFATALGNLANLFFDTGRYEEAEPLMERVLEIRREQEGESHQKYGLALNNLALLYLATGRAERGLELLTRGVAVADRIIGEVFSIASESMRMSHLTVLRTEFDTYLSAVLARGRRSDPTVQTAFDFVLRRKAVEAEASAMQRELVFRGRYPHLEPVLREMLALRTQIARKELAGPETQPAAEYTQQLAAWNSRREELEKTLSQQIPEMNIEKRLRHADRGAVARALPKGSALVEFVRLDVYDFAPAGAGQHWGPPRYVAFVLTNGARSRARMFDLGAAEEIEHMISAFRTKVTGVSEAIGKRHFSLGGRREDYDSSSLPSEDGSNLRAKIFDPLVRAFGGRTRLFLSPDGDLTRLPFEILPASDGRRLIDDYRISYLSVGRDLLRSGEAKAGRSTNAAPSPPLVIADPDYELAARPADAAASEPRRARQSAERARGVPFFNPLPGTRDEGRHVADVLKAELLTREGALEGSIKEWRSPSILHVATHGYFLFDRPHEREAAGLAGEAGAGRFKGRALANPLLLSGLALAGANAWLRGETLPERAEDGLLTAADVAGLDLIETDLVFLSACGTGLGKVLIGEGVFGLRRAFAVAGAKNLIMSLWSVPDQGTRALVEDFYKFLLEGRDPSDALREAQLAMKKKVANPFYWGAFICQGPPRATPKGTRPV
ncbi:MAG TPA: CHAT domain-containing tetratricopeptide repeat protein [Pyrinomonadaceae bacterium]